MAHEYLWAKLATGSCSSSVGPRSLPDKSRLRGDNLPVMTRNRKMLSNCPKAGDVYLRSIASK